MARRPDVTLMQLRYFLRAATHNSMTLAALELRVAQSAVSASIAQLERQLGAQLFIRQRSRGLLLTPAGEEFLSDARAALAHVDEVLDSARGKSDHVSGRLRLACFTTLAPFVLPDLLADLAEHHPDLEIDVLEVEADALAAAVRSGAAELAIGYDLGLGHDIDRQVVATVQPHVLLRPDHRLAAHPRIHLRDLAADPMVLLDLPHSREYFQECLASAGVTPQVRHRSVNYETVRGLVARGHGYSLLNLRSAGDTTYCGASLVTVPIADPMPGLSVVIARLTSVRQSARARAVAARAHSVLREAPALR